MKDDKGINYYPDDNNYSKKEVIINTIKGKINFNNTTKKLVTMGNNGYKNEEELMNNSEKELYKSFNTDIERYVFLKGLEKYNYNDYENILEKRRYLTAMILNIKEDRKYTKEKIYLLDKMMSENTGIEHETYYNSLKNVAVFAHPTYNELKEKFNNKQHTKK